MASWFARRRQLAELPRLRSRRERGPVERVDLHELTPDPLSYLAQAAYLQLVTFQTLSGALTAAPALAHKQLLMDPIAAALERHRAFVSELRRQGEDPVQTMDAFTKGARRLYDFSQGDDWRESLLGAYVTAGLLEDFFIRVSGGLPNEVGVRAAEILGSGTDDSAVLEVLRQEIERTPELGSMLAVWGRRLVGDTLLIARSVLRGYERLEASEEREIEPIFTELIAAHTRRMDALGLTA